MIIEDVVREISQNEAKEEKRPRKEKNQVVKHILVKDAVIQVYLPKLYGEICAF